MGSMTLAAASCIQYHPNQSTMTTGICKCGTMLLPFVTGEVCRCSAGRKRYLDDAEAIRQEIRRHALDDTDIKLSVKVNRTPHHVYRIRQRMGLNKYRTDHYVRPTRTAA